MERACDKQTPARRAIVARRLGSWRRRRIGSRLYALFVGRPLGARLMVSSSVTTWRAGPTRSAERLTKVTEPATPRAAVLALPHGSASTADGSPRGRRSRGVARIPASAAVRQARRGLPSVVPTCRRRVGAPTFLAIASTERTRRRRHVARARPRSCCATPEPTGRRVVGEHRVSCSGTHLRRGPHHHPSDVQAASVVALALAQHRLARTSRTGSGCDQPQDRTAIRVATVLAAIAVAALALRRRGCCRPRRPFSRRFRLLAAGIGGGLS